ncbi:PLP-dependent aminotransferase family protein [Actinomycetes bacterium KLBMP 9797]
MKLIGPIVHVTITGTGDIATQIYRQILDAVVDGRLRPGERLPPSRELARRLAVSRNTVAAAYERLTADGYLVGRVGAGTYVCLEALDRRPRSAPAGRDVRPRAFWRDLALSKAATGPAQYDFTVGVPDTRLFPLDTWRRLVSRELRHATIGTGDYGDPAGLTGLRTAIARYIGVSRGVRAAADDVLVTHGAQQALDLIARVMVEPGGRVAVEEPGYPPARLLFRSLGARVVGVPVDDEGIDVAALPADARVVYVTPSHQYPLGVPMSVARRAALLAWAERHNAVVVEDDYDSEYRFEDRPLPPLQSLDRHGRVLYVGTFAKTMLPMLRTGFLVAPASLLPALRAAKELSDWHNELSTQAALAAFLAEGHLARHVRKTTLVYAERRARLATALRRHLAPWLVPVRSVAGLHVCARVAPGVHLDTGEVARRAAAAGVVVDTLTRFRGDAPAQHGLVIGYGAIPADRIDDGIRRLTPMIKASL